MKHSPKLARILEEMNAHDSGKACAGCGGPGVPGYRIAANIYAEDGRPLGELLANAEAYFCPRCAEKAAAIGVNRIDGDEDTEPTTH